MTEVSPDAFLDAVLGYQKTAAIKAALALDLFSAIGEGADRPDSLAARTGADGRGLRILCDYLTVQGLLVKHDGAYGLTPSSGMFLTRSSPAWLGGTADFLAAPEMMRLWLDDPAAPVRNGGSPGLANLAPDNPVWVTFAKAMVPFMAPLAEALGTTIARWPRPPRRMLDIAAGHGMFGIAIARQVPGLTVTALDWAPVLQVAEANAAAAGLTERYRTLAGSALELDWGGGYDLVLLANFLHHFDEPTCVALLRRARQSLAPGGRTLAVEFVPNEDRVSPPMPAMFAYMMLGSTPKGDAYTASELARMGRAAGFARVSTEPLGDSPETLLTFEPDVGNRPA